LLFANPSPVPTPEKLYALEPLLVTVKVFLLEKESEPISKTAVPLEE
jgi:hypothetical protein